MLKNNSQKPKAETRNLSVYKDDYDFFFELSEQNDRSKARMFRYAMAQIREGNPIPYTQENGKAAK